jgi:hypothetical protein
MSEKKYDFFLPVVLSVDEFDRLQDSIKLVKDISKDSIFGELSYSDIVYRAVCSYANVVRKLREEEFEYDLCAELEEVALTHMQSQGDCSLP